VSIYPILAALKRHKTAVFLIVLQIALTLAIVANAFFTIGQTIEQMLRPTGVDEAGLIIVLQKLPPQAGENEAAIIEQLDSLQLTDLEAIRKLPDVQDVAASTSFPLLQGDDSGDLSIEPDHKGKIVYAAYYYGDSRLRQALGLHLIAGRDFFESEIKHGQGAPGSPVVIVSKPVADALFPDGDALGRSFYQDGKIATIVGIVERLETQSGSEPWAFNTVLEPLRADGYWPGYVVRARPGRTAEAIHAIKKALMEINPVRHMPLPWAGIQAFSDRRYNGMAEDRGMATLMGVVCVVLLSVTAAGIVGLTSFWVGQRTRQIGVRRALGARRVDILRYFQLENMLITAGGVILGTLLAFELNQWLMMHYEMARLPALPVGIGVVVLFVLGQLAVLVPAIRASHVPPVVATR